MVYQRIPLLDARLLDFLVDDYYGLWEVQKIVNAFFPSRTKAKQEAREMSGRLLAGGLADLYFRIMPNESWEKQPSEQALSTIQNERFWQPPESAANDEYFALTISTDGEKRLQQDWPAFPD